MRLSLAAFACLSVAPFAAASTETASIRPMTSAQEQVLFDERLHEGIWARGVDWKASFSASGATFVPYLGSEAPQNYPLAFGVPQISVGDLVIALQASALPERAGETIRFERGVVDEVYITSSHGIEQRFVVEVRVGSGAIVVRVPVVTDLEPAIDGVTLRFVNEHGGVDYGSATAIDASGRTLALERTFDGDAIGIVVPADFADSARYPLVIDPVISSFGVFTGTPQDESSPDVAYNSTTQQFLAVAEVAFSATDHDVVSILLERDGTPVAGSALAVDASAEYWATPRCAAFGVLAGFDVVAAVGLPSQIARQIRSRIRDASSFQAAVVLSDADDGDNYLPDVGGVDISINEHYCAVWQSELGGDLQVNGRMITGAGAVPGLMVRVATDPAFRDGRPSVSSGAGGASFEVVFEREISSTDFDIYFAFVQNAGVVTTAASPLVTGPTDDRFPSVSDITGSGTVRGMIAFQRQVAGNANVMVAEHPFGLALQNLFDLSALDPTTEPNEQFTPVIECDGERFVLAWAERDSFGTSILSAEFHASAFEPLLGVSRQIVSPSATDARGPRLAGRSGDVGTNIGVMAIWSDEVSGGARDVFGASYEPAIGIPPRSVCFGDGTGGNCPCGNVGAAGNGCPNSLNPSGALLGSTGNAAKLADTLTLRGSGMPPNTTCLYFQGNVLNAPAPPFGDGLRCATGSVVRLGVKFNSPSGASQYPDVGDTSIFVRGALPFAAGKRIYQGWYRNAAGFCTSATFNLTNGLEVDWTIL